jgi:hypothetical protein
MSEVGYHLSILTPGIVVIHEETHSTAYTEASLRKAIAATKRTRDEFNDQEHYQNTLNMYESALKLLLEDWS